MIKKLGIVGVTAVACLPLQVSAQPIATIPVAIAATIVQRAPAPGRAILRQGTSVSLRTLDALNSKHTKQGERFNLEVSEAVKISGSTVIPVGARGVGEVTSIVKKGAFGKSGKIDTRLLYLLVDGHQIRLDGKAHDAGSGGTAGTVAVAVLAGVFSAFVTGKSADLPSGSVMNGYTAEDIEVMLQPAAQTPSSQSAPESVTKSIEPVSISTPASK